jgi:hypothetical protein
MGPFKVEWLYSHSCWLHIHHPTTRNCGGRSNSQILNLKHHCHIRSKCKYLSGIEAQFFIIIQDCIHILDPESIHWPIKHNPMALACTIRATLPYCIGKNTVHPLARDLVEHTVELTHCYRFWVEDMGIYLVIALVLKGC